jgi:hypothetical protein
MAVSTTYPWTRYWATRQGALSLAEMGLLPDPEVFVGTGIQLWRLEQRREAGLLVLLGQPGMGKSTAITAEVAALQELGIANDRFELAGYDTGAYLKDELLSSGAVARWRAGEECHLFIDGLDRALVQWSVIINVLTSVLRAPATDMSRLRLRIACRSADWQDALRNRLVDLWPGTPGDTPNVDDQELELLGLTAADVVAAANHQQIDSEWLLGEIEAKGAAALAATPMTLIMILEAAREEGVLGSRAALYRRVARRQIEDHDPPGRSTDDDVLDADEAMALAARQAAAILLCDRAAISDALEPAGHDAALTELAGGTEPVPGGNGEVPADRRSLRDVQRTALMRIVGDRRVAFPHHTYAEYLCAVWLASGRLSATQVNDLLVNPHDPQGQLLSHLRDVAGWLAALRPDVFGELLKTQAEVLLRGDLAFLEPEAQAVVVSALLSRAQHEPIPLWEGRVRGNLARLRYPELIEDLRPVIVDSAAEQHSRILAITLAEIQRLVGLDDELVSVALDGDDDRVVRDAATRAVARISGQATRSRLTPLAFETISDDVDDQIKGNALEAVWPEIIDAAQLLAHLTRAKRNNFYGSYKAFLRHAAADIPVDDLAAAITWGKDQPRGHHATDAISGFVDDLVFRGWHEVSRDDVADALAELFAERIGRHLALVERDPRGERSMLDDTTGRQRLLERLLRFVDGTTVHARWLSASRPAVLRSDDIPWLCERLLAEEDEARERTWADLVEAAFWPETGPVDIVLETAEHSVLLRERLRYWLDSVRRDSEQAQTDREHYLMAQPTSEEEADDDEAAFDPDARVVELLEEGEAGDANAWWQLNEILRYPRERGGEVAFESESRITMLPGWERQSELIRGRLVGLAADYLVARDAEPGEWFAQRKGWRPARAGYRALVLLQEHAPDVLDRMSADRWSVWVPAIVDFPLFADPEDSPDRVIMLRSADAAPDDVVEWTVKKIRVDDKALEQPTLPRCLPHALGLAELRARLLELAADDGLRSATRLALYTILLEVNEPEAIDAALATAQANITRLASVGEADEEPMLAVGLLSMLLRRAPAPVWDTAWPLLQSDELLQEQVVDMLARFESFELAAELPESAVADFYMLLLEKYPPADDPDDDGFVGPRQQVGWWRDRLLDVLIQRATRESAVETRRIAAAFPQWPGLGRRARAAETAHAEAVWRAPTPLELVALVETPQRRIVQSPGQLQEVVLESLARAGDRLQSQWPKAWQLWNDKPLQPKSEERLSDWIKDWLDEDLARRIVTTREPQVEPTERGAGLGARNDLRIELPASGDYAAVAIIIEVKRCWHPKLNTAARTQLADGYLKSAGLSHGIYVVGYYSAARWNGPGSKRSATKTLSQWQVAMKAQVEDASRKTGKRIDSCVLDISLRSDRMS